MTGSRFGRFSLIGLSGAALQLLLLSLLTKTFRVPAAAMTPIAVELVILHNFLWHERFTWRDRASARALATRFMRFHLSNGLVSIIGNTAITYCLVEGLKTPALLAEVTAIALCSIFNFLLADRWVYAPRQGT